MASESLVSGRHHPNTEDQRRVSHSTLQQLDSQRAPWPPSGVKRDSLCCSDEYTGIRKSSRLWATGSNEKSRMGTRGTGEARGANNMKTQFDSTVSVARTFKKVRHRS